MSAVSTAELVLAARASGIGVAAFNVITLEHAEAIVSAAEQTRLPVILQISENAVKFHGGRSWNRCSPGRRRSRGAPPYRSRCTWTMWRTRSCCGRASRPGCPP